jgi:hypothetical protein
MRITAQVDTKNLDSLIRNLPDATNRAVRETAFEIERIAKQEAPVDTGALRASIYTVTNRPGENGKSRAIGDATKPRWSKRDQELKVAPAVTGQTPEPAHSNQAYVVAGVEYAQVVHEVHPSKSHFLLKAGWRMRSKFREKIRQLMRGLVR